jgi:hypothetical protein
MPEPISIAVEFRPPALPEARLTSRADSRFSLELMFVAVAVLLVVQCAHPSWSISAVQLGRGAIKTLPILLAATVASVIIHEAGHLVPSLLFGFYVSRVSIGPISLSRVYGQWKLQYSRALLSASVSAMPPDGHAWRTRMLLVLAGGPLATLGTFVAAACFLENGGPARPSILVWCALCQINFLLFVLGLIPNGVNSRVRNDARLFLTVLKNDKYAEQIRVYHEVSRLQIAGVRPSEYSAELVSRLASAEGNYDLMLFNAMAIFLWALDSGQIARADNWDVYANELIALAPLRLSNTMRAESAVFDLLYRDLPASAAQKLGAVKREALSPWLRERAKAALELVSGRHEKALAHVATARRLLSPSASYSQFESRLLDLIENRAIITDSRTLGARAA